MKIKSPKRKYLVQKCGKDGKWVTVDAFRKASDAFREAARQIKSNSKAVAHAKKEWDQDWPLYQYRVFHRYRLLPVVWPDEVYRVPSYERSLAA